MDCAVASSRFLALVGPSYYDECPHRVVVWDSLGTAGQEALVLINDERRQRRQAMVDARRAQRRALRADREREGSDSDSMEFWYTRGQVDSAPSGRDLLGESLSASGGSEYSEEDLSESE